MACLDDLEPMSVPLVIFGACAAVLVALEQIPQYRKLLLTRTSAGLSSYTLGIGNLASGFNVINLTILHANQIALCFGEAGARCLPSLLVLCSGCSAFLVCSPIYWFAVRFGASGPRIAARRAWMGIGAQAALLAVAGLPALASILPSGSCQTYRRYAHVVGFSNTALLTSQYLPQVSTRMKHSTLPHPHTEEFDGRHQRTAP